MLNRLRSSGSLRRRLALLLLPSLLLLLLLSAFAQYLLAVLPLQRELDRGISDVALALADRVDVDETGHLSFVLSEEAAALLDADALDYNWYAVFNEAHQAVSGELGIPWPAAQLVRGEPYLFDAVVNERPVRAAAVLKTCGTLDCGVVLASTLRKRSRLVRDIQLSALLPVALVGALAFALVWFGLGSGLRPLVRMSSEIERRSVRDLSAVKVAEAPGEVQPLVAAVNRLMLQLAEASAAQQKFLATAAHQLRTPLAGLQSRIELAQLECADQKSQQHLAVIHESAARSARLAVQLLSLARAEPGASSADQMAELDLARLAAELVDEWVPRAIAKDIDLGFELAPARVSGSSLLLRELMVNLLHNALEYTPAGGMVTLSTLSVSGESCLVVEDNGPGIAADLREQALQRFVRLPGSRGGGSGLGLAIVKEIADAHQARLELLDAQSGVGLRVRLSFPSA